MTQTFSVHPSLTGAWTEFLSARPWDLFLTLTSDHRTHPEALLKRFRYCCNKIGDAMYGRRRQRTGQAVEFVLGLERHRSGWPHSHAVLRLAGVDLADPLQFNLGHWQRFISDTGGWCWLERPSSSTQVVSYCAKYILKEGDLILSDNLNPYEASAQLALLNPATATARRNGRRSRPPDGNRR